MVAKYQMETCIDQLKSQSQITPGINSIILCIYVRLRTVRLVFYKSHICMKHNSKSLLHVKVINFNHFHENVN